jgi:hypothetical protein
MHSERTRSLESRTSRFIRTRTRATTVPAFRDEVRASGSKAIRLAPSGLSSQGGEGAKQIASLITAALRGSTTLDER